MDLDLFSDYFHTDKRQHQLKRITMILFFALVVEKLLSCFDMAVSEGTANLYFSITAIDIICIAIYLSTAILIALHVRYDRLVIPDFFLLGVKLWIIVSETVFLLTRPDAGNLEKFSAAEHIAEAVIFAVFLICMFTGELSHGKKLPNFANVCMNLLMICFPLTVLMELAKVFIAYEAHISEYIVAFHFIRDVLNEAFLDAPYFMLILMVCLTPDEGHGELHAK